MDTSLIDTDIDSRLLMNATEDPTHSEGLQAVDQAMDELVQEHGDLQQLVPYLKPGSVTRQLDAILESIRHGDCTLSHAEADLLLRNVDDDDVQKVVTKRKYENRIPQSVFCTFFVHPSGAKRSADDDDWLEVTKSGYKSLIKGHGPPHEGVVRYSMSIADKLKREELSLGCFTRVALPGHLQWDELKPRPKEKDEWRYLSERISVVNVGPAALAPAAPAIMPEQPPANAQSSTAGHDLNVAGSVTVGGDLQVEGRVRCDIFESNNADFAEVFVGEDGEEYGEGEVLLRVGRSVSRGPAFGDGEVPAGGYLVRSSHPCLVGGPKLSAEEQPRAVRCAMLGQVDVRVSGDAPIEARLVPSGLGDGRAVALRPCDADGARAKHVVGIVVGPGDADGCVKAFVAPWGLSADTALGAVQERLRALEAGERRLESVLARLSEAFTADSPTPAPTATPLSPWLARRMVVERAAAKELPSDAATAELPDEVAAELMRDGGPLSLAGVLLVMLGWRVLMDEADELDEGEAPGGSTLSAAAATQRGSASLSQQIFETLGEHDLSYQRKLHKHMGLLGLSAPELRQLADAALRQAQEDPSHSAGRWFGMKLDERIKLRQVTATHAATTATAPKEARAYQRELAEKVGGRNAIVVCATGSGKTLVSCLVIERALADPARGGVVVYLEKIRHMVKQQKVALDAHFAPHGHGLDFVGDYVGGDTYVPDWSVMRERHTIVVMTVDLFLQRLQGGQVRTRDCRLVVFDECHSATKAHSYHKVNIALQQRAAAEGVGVARPPQVLGMTATPTWKDTLDENMLALAQLSKNMSEAEIVMVSDNVEDLQRHVHPPREERHPLQPRSEDEAYRAALPAVMEELEGVLAEPFGYEPAVTSAMVEAASALQAIRAAPNAPTGYSRSYEGELRARRGGADGAALRASALGVLLLQLLEALNAADSLTCEVGFESAQCVLGSALFRGIELAAAAAAAERLVCLDVVKSVLESPLCAERFVRPLLRSHPHATRGAAGPSAAAAARGCSPKLERLVRCLEPLCEPKSEQKAIVFVQTRAAARRVVNFLETEPQLRGAIRPAVFCGHAVMSSREQQQVAEAFKLGRCNVLVATSVAEEGLDAPDTRVAIMLDGLTSGRARDQCRGRVMRRPGGEFHIFYYEGTREDTGVWRSQQQSQAAQAALGEVARLGTSNAFANLSIGANPLMKLNELKAEHMAELNWDLPEHAVNGLFRATVRLTVASTGLQFTAGSQAKSKKTAKSDAAERLLQKMIDGESDASDVAAM